MRCKDYNAAREQATANAEQTNVAWGYFTDSSGNWRAELWASCKNVPGATMVEPTVYETGNPSSYVAWDMLDGSTMAGQVKQLVCGHYYVQRVDGTTCIVPEDKLRPATWEEVEHAIKFYCDPAYRS